jgi:hypothetical protein
MEPISKTCNQFLKNGLRVPGEVVERKLLQIAIRVGIHWKYRKHHLAAIGSGQSEEGKLYKAQPHY